MVSKWFRGRLALAMGLYAVLLTFGFVGTVLGVVLQMQRQSGQRIGIGLKCLWTASFLLSVLHVLAAFHFVHHWSHGEAYFATAEETRQKLGFAYGAGVYFNYLFFVVWAAEVFWTWWSPERWTKLTRWLILAGRCYLLLIAFNAVVVFESGWLRTLGGVATVAILAIAMRNHGKRFFNTRPTPRHADPNSPSNVRQNVCVRPN